MPKTDKLYWEENRWEEEHWRGEYVEEYLEEDLSEYGEEAWSDYEEEVIDGMFEIDDECYNDDESCFFDEDERSLSLEPVYENKDMYEFKDDENCSECGSNAEIPCLYIMPDLNGLCELTEGHKGPHTVISSYGDSNRAELLVDRLTISESRAGYASLDRSLLEVGVSALMAV